MTKEHIRDLVIATKNAKKLRELKRYLKNLPFRVVSLADFPKTPRIIEDGATFEANAVKKARTIARFTGGLVIADDSGLEVKALGGRPGVYSARFAGLHKSDDDNNAKVLKLLKDTPASKRGARFVCAIAIADGKRVVKTAEKYCQGRIAYSVAGKHGFGYDSIFLIPKYGKTFGELGLKAKDRMSHRAKALAAAREFLRKYVRSYPGA